VNTVLGSKRLAFCATVELSYNVFLKLNHLHISTSVPATSTRTSASADITPRREFHACICFYDMQ